MVFLVQLILAALALMASDGKRPGDFTIVGPGGGGAMFHPTISPHDAETVLVSCDMTGAYISHNGGKSWRMFNLRGVVEFFVFDLNDKNVIYAQATGLWRSSDNGETWKLVYPRASAIKAIKMDSDHSDEDIIADPDPLSTIFAMAVDPKHSRTFYVTAGNRAKGSFGVFISRDAGESWSKLADLPDLANKIWVDPYSPKNDRTLVIAGPHFLARQRAKRIDKLSPPSGKNLTDISVGFSSQGKPIFYAIEDETAFVSEDDATTWRKVTLGEGAIKTRAIEIGRAWC